jgi:hypothetical protein
MYAMNHLLHILMGDVDQAVLDRSNLLDRIERLEGQNQLLRKLLEGRGVPERNQDYQHHPGPPQQEQAQGL